jgi:hypothetical protein
MPWKYPMENPVSMCNLKRLLDNMSWIHTWRVILLMPWKCPNRKNPVFMHNLERLLDNMLIWKVIRHELEWNGRKAKCCSILCLLAQCSWGLLHNSTIEYIHTYFLQNQIVKTSLKDIRYRLTIKEILDVKLPFIGSFKELTVRLSNWWWEGMLPL